MSVSITMFELLDSEDDIIGPSDANAQPLLAILDFLKRRNLSILSRYIKMEMVYLPPSEVGFITTCSFYKLQNITIIAIEIQESSIKGDVNKLSESKVKSMFDQDTRSQGGKRQSRRKDKI
ncbi:hypothetical protein Tco_0855999 [Tanacetum coccineum]